MWHGRKKKVERGGSINYNSDDKQHQEIFKLTRWRKWREEEKKSKRDESKGRFTVSHRGGNLNRTRFKSALEWWKKNKILIWNDGMKKRTFDPNLVVMHCFFEPINYGGEKMERWKKSERMCCACPSLLSFFLFFLSFFAGALFVAHSSCMHPKNGLHTQRTVKESRS